MHKYYLSLELVLAFFFIPIVIFIGWIASPIMTVFLIGAMIPAFLWLKKNGKQKYWFGPNKNLEKALLKKLIVRFLLIAITTVLTLYVFAPERLFLLPTTQPLKWILFVCLYCLISVYPQELLFRKFFTERYQKLFNHQLIQKTANAMTFGFVHIVFQNWVAVVLTIFAGWLFADTYEKSDSLRLVALEHGLYGILVFSVGLDPYFLLASNPFGFS